MARPTLIRSVMGVSPPNVRAGAITFKGEAILGLPPHLIAKRGVGYVPQGRRLFPSLTVTEHLTVLKPASATHGWTVRRRSSSSPASRNAATIAATSCPAASGRCWPWPARS